MPSIGLQPKKGIIYTEILQEEKRSDDAFSEIFLLEASPVESQKLLRKDKKMRRRKSEKN